MARSALYPKSVTPGIPKLGDVPEGWAAKKMGTLMRKVKRPAILEDDHEYQLVNAKRGRGGVVSRERLRGSLIKVKTQFHTKADDFLISRRQIIHGACGVVPPSLDGAVVSNEYDTMVVEPEELVLDYLDAVSHTPYFQRCTFHSSIGVDVEKMIFKLDQFLQLPMLVPPLPEQRKIAEILSSVDEAIQATKAVIEQTRRVKEGLLQELLTKGIGHTRFKKTAIGEIPESWSTARLGDMLTEVSYGTSEPANGDSTNLPILRIPNVAQGHIDLTSLKYIDLSPNVVKRYSIFPDDILVVRTNGNPSVVGRCALVTDGLGPMTYASYLIKLVADRTRILPAFVVEFTNSIYGREYLDRQCATSAGNYNINSTQLRGMSLPVPPLEEQSEIVLRLSSATHAGADSLSELDQLRRLKAGLLQDLLTGKVRVAV